MAGSKRERELARAKYERQQAKRARTAARRRQRTQVVTAVVVAVAVVAGLVAVAKLVTERSPSPVTAASTTKSTPTSTASATAAAIPTDGSNATCSYPAGGGTTAKKVTAPPTSAPTRPVTATATIVLNGKPVTVQLLTSKAPCTVNSFRHLAALKYFDKTPCHRLTKGSLAVLQCGDPTGTGSGGPGYSFADENLAGATYPAGTLAMANSGPSTNGSQFFIVYANSTLGPSYTPFGTVVGGLSVVQAIAAVGVKGGGTDGAPAKPVTITSVTVRG